MPFRPMDLPMQCVCQSLYFVPDLVLVKTLNNQVTMSVHLDRIDKRKGGICDNMIPENAPITPAILTAPWISPNVCTLFSTHALICSSFRTSAMHVRICIPGYFSRKSCSVFSSRSELVPMRERVASRDARKSGASQELYF